jgi:p-aminobenzoyl-glutamate transporter AbgT
MKPEPRLTPEQTAKRRAEYAPMLSDEITEDERRAARGFIVGFVLASAAVGCVVIAFAAGRML